MAKKRKFISLVRVFISELNEHIDPNIPFELTFVPEVHQPLVDAKVLLPYREQVSAALLEEASDGPND